MNLKGQTLAAKRAAAKVGHPIVKQKKQVEEEDHQNIKIEQDFNEGEDSHIPLPGEAEECKFFVSEKGEHVLDSNVKSELEETETIEPSQDTDATTQYEVIVFKFRIRIMNH